MQKIKYIHANNPEVRLRLALRQLQEHERQSQKKQLLQFSAMVIACLVLASLAILAPVAVTAAYEKFFF